MPTTSHLEHNPNVDFHELESLHKDAYGWALSQCYFKPDEAEDVLQTAYMQIFTGQAKYRGTASLKTWWFAVIRNIARRRKFRLTMQLRLFSEKLHLINTDQDMPQIITQEESIHKQQLNKKLIHALYHLPQRQRDIIELVFYRELTIEQAAEVIGVSIGTARVHYARAKKSLLNSLQGLLDNE